MKMGADGRFQQSITRFPDYITRAELYGRDCVPTKNNNEITMK